MLYQNLNGKTYKADEALIHPDNRSFRYGEGLFETIRLCKNKMPLWEKHWNRISKSLPKLYFEQPGHFTSEKLKEQVLQLANKNKCADAARVRITFFKGEGGLWETPSTAFNYLIQCWPLEQNEFVMNENGFNVGVFEAGKKSCDSFSSLKTNNYLLYALAAQYAKQQKWNDAIVLNQHGRICDTTIANLFFIRDNIIHTPQVSEGCVEGVMRSYLLESFTRAGLKLAEGSYTVSDLQEADEIFLSNAFYGIRWVKQLGDKDYDCNQSALFFQKFLLPLF
jgi:branched-chain amino acid aminotransferase